MNTELTTAEKIRNLPWSYAANATNVVFAQLTFGGSTFVLFLNALGMSKSGIGFLLSLFPFLGLTALFTAPAVARFGYKRTYLTFWGMRKIVIGFLLFTPWVLSAFGAWAAHLYVAGIVAAFAACRAIGETGLYPWVQEYVPNAVRGKYSATDSIISTLTQLLAVAVAGYVVGQSTGLSGFMTLILVGVAFGLLSVWSSSHIPGGAPIHDAQAQSTPNQSLARAVRDRDFRLFLLGAGLMTLTTGPLASFLPLFMQEQVGLTLGQVVWLQTGALMGGLLSSYVWGWAADRYGSKPVMLSGLSLVALLPLCWMVMPRHTAASLYVAIAIALMQGVVGQGWAIGSARQLFVSVIPPEQKTAYTALYYAWVGGVGGVSQLMGGRLLDYTASVSGRYLVFTLDPYTVLFVAGVFLPVISSLLLRGIRTDSRVGVGEFASMFFQGNPFLAAESLIRFSRARDEYSVVAVTERLGQAKSPLTVDELLEALSDPRFNVRFEAIIAMSRMPPDARSIRALSEILGGSEPALSVIAAWALGRIDDARAVPSLRAALDSRYRSVQAHSVRALGTLRDTEIAPVLLERLAHETDHGLQIAYASALGKLGTSEAIEPLLALLQSSRDKGSQMELALAVARMVGDEHYFIQLARQARLQTGTAVSQAVTALKRRMGKYPGMNGDLIAQLEDCVEAFAREDLRCGVALLSRIVSLLPREWFDQTEAMTLQNCAARLSEFETTRPEYLFLALHTLNSTDVA